MADVRDLISSSQSTGQSTPFWRRLLSRSTLALRRVVVQTSFPPFTAVYAAIYRAHVWYARRQLKSMPGVRAAYLARGAASDGIVYGVSDIDLLVFGDWTDEQQASFRKAFGRLIASSPLYDHTAAIGVNTLESLRALYQSDYFFQFRFDWARRQSELIWGEDVLADLPPIPADRIRGGYWMELKLMWMMYMTSVFGSGPTATDRIFQNSIAVKNVAAAANMERAFATGVVEYSRREALAQALSTATSRDREILERMAQCLQRRYLRYDGDVQNDSLQYLLRAAERIQPGLGGEPPFDPVAGTELEVDAPAEEVLFAAGTAEHARRLVAQAKGEWRGFRAGFLLPRSSFGGLDELQLLIEVDPAALPSVEQVRRLCRSHGGSALRQRVALYLLLPWGAYLLERQSQLEFWQVLLTSAANPETFALLARPEYALEGEPRAGGPSAPWTRFAAGQIEQELALRRQAMAKPPSQAPTEPLQILRGVWRQLQLEVIQRSVPSGRVRFPLTVPAVRRGMQSWGLPDSPILEEMEKAYELELDGKPSAAATLIPQAISLFRQFQNG